MTPRGERWLDRDLPWVATACVAIALAYLRTVDDFFTQDDFGVVWLLASKPWTTFPQWFVMPWMEGIWGFIPDEIRPFPALSYQLTALPGGAVPHAHHLLNIALHAGNAALVYAVAREAAGLPRPAAGLAATAFGLLPVGAESVAWITGRVDSMPALFYLASFLAYVRWRSTAVEKGPAPFPSLPYRPGNRPKTGPGKWGRSFFGRRGGARLYWWSVAWLFVALFSKQNTITLVAALAAYDWIVLKRALRPSWTWIKPYVPFAVLTLGYLLLRAMVFGEMLRGSQIASRSVADIAALLLRHLQRILVGGSGAPPANAVIAAALLAAITWAAIAATPAARRADRTRRLLFTGPVWIGLGLAPAIAATYESPRHAYLAAAGWAMLVGLIVEGLAGTAASWSRRQRQAVVAFAAVLLIVYGVRLHNEVSDWRSRAEVSERAALALDREVMAAAAGTLVIAGAPASSWEWAMPFVARPPFASTDLLSRTPIITPRQLHCCQGGRWDQETRDAVARWSTSARPVVAIWTSADGAVRRLVSTDDQELAAIVRYLPEIASSDTLDQVVRDILARLVVQRGQLLSPSSTESP